MRHLRPQPWRPTGASSMACRRAFAPCATQRSRPSTSKRETGVGSTTAPSRSVSCAIPSAPRNSPQNTRPSTGRSRRSRREPDTERLCSHVASAPGTARLKLQLTFCLGVLKPCAVPVRGPKGHRGPTRGPASGSRLPRGDVALVQLAVRTRHAKSGRTGSARSRRWICWPLRFPRPRTRTDLGIALAVTIETEQARAAGFRLTCLHF